jgi:hypothetical protein
MDAATAINVRLLSIFHYVLAGLGALFSLFPGIYIAMGVAFLSGKFPPAKGTIGPPPQLGWLFIAFGVAFMLAGLGYVVLVVLAGRFLGRSRHWTYCMVVAALSCAFFPFGTVLGVFTIVVLSKPEVKAAFGAGPPAAGATRTIEPSAS